MRKEKGVSLIVLIVTTVILYIIAGIIWYNVYKIKNESTIKENNDTSSEVVADNYDDENEDSEDDEDERVSIDLGKNIWNGYYTNGSNSDIEIYMYRCGEDQMYLGVINNNEEISKYSIGSYTFGMGSEDNIVYKDEYIGTSIEINRDGDIININASSDDEEDLLNFITGEYTKKEYESLNWDGCYKNEDYVIILSEVAENELYITICEDVSESNYKCEEFDEQQIKLEEEFLGDETIINIEKIENGIDVNISILEDDELTEIVGEFEKVD